MSFLWILWSRIGVMSYKERLGYVTTVIRYHQYYHTELNDITFSFKCLHGKIKQT